MKLIEKTLHLRFSPINPHSDEVSTRSGLVGPKIAFSVEETGVSWSGPSDQQAPSKMYQLTPTIQHCKSSLITKAPINLDTANNQGVVQ